MFEDATDPCRLRETADIHTHCDGDACVYWRAVRHLGLDSQAEGCAIQHFELLEGGTEVAAWLLSVKTRLESQQDACRPLASGE